MPGPGTGEVGTPSGLCIRVQQLGAYALYTQHHNSVYHIWDGTCVLGARTPISSMAHRSWHTQHRMATCDPAHLAHAPGHGGLMQSHTCTHRDVHTRTQHAAKPASHNAHSMHTYTNSILSFLLTHTPSAPPQLPSASPHVPGAQGCSQSQHFLSLLLAPPALSSP